VKGLPGFHLPILNILPIGLQDNILSPQAILISPYMTDEAELVEIGVVRITPRTCYQNKEIPIDWKGRSTGKVNGR